MRGHLAAGRLDNLDASAASVYGPRGYKGATPVTVDRHDILTMIRAELAAARLEIQHELAGMIGVAVRRQLDSRLSPPHIRERLDDAPAEHFLRSYPNITAGITEARAIDDPER